MELLFDRCNDYKKTTGLKHLLAMYKAREYHKNPSQEYTNDRLTNYLNEEPSNENGNGLDSSYRPLMRFRREITEECCINACKLEDLKKYCIMD